MKTINSAISGIQASELRAFGTEVLLALGVPPDLVQAVRNPHPWRENLFANLTPLAKLAPFAAYV